MTAAKSSGRTQTRPTHRTKPVTSKRGRPSRRGYPPRFSGQPDVVDLHDSQRTDLVELEHDPLVLLATGHWNNQLRTKPTTKVVSAARQPVLWKPSVVELVYQDHLVAKEFAPQKVAFLEQSQYLERYLWPHYPSDQSASVAHTVSIVVLINEKFRQRLPDPWQFLTVDDRASSFSRFFGDVAQLLTGSTTFPALVVRTRQELLVFLTNCFQTLENDTVRKECMKLVTVSLWHSIQHSQIRETEFKVVPMFKKMWKYLEKKYARATAAEQQAIVHERSLLPRLLAHGIITFRTTSVEKVDPEILGYIEQLLELVIELESLLPTRRYFHLVLVDHQMVVHGRSSSWYTAITDKRFDRFRRLVDMLEYYVNFEVDNHTGEPFTEQQCTEHYYQRMGELQFYLFQTFPDQLRSFVLASVAQLEDPQQFYRYLDQLDHSQLVQLCNHLGVRTLPLFDPFTDPTDEFPSQPMDLDSSPTEPVTYDKAHLLAVLSAMYQRRIRQIEQINGLPLFPDENLLFDDALNPAKVTQRRIMLADLARPLTSCTGSSHQGTPRQLCYPLPRLNLQFLTLQDYLLRNFALFRLESAYEIRQDIEDAVQRLGPRLVQEAPGSGTARVPSGSQFSTQFLGWSRMALPIDSFTVVQIGKPYLGQNIPSQVKADVTVNVSRYTDSILTEWDDQVRPQDVLFLVTVMAKSWTSQPYQPTERSFTEHYGIRYVRGCQVCDVLGDDGSPVDERGKPRDDSRKPRGALRTYRVLLDPNQFAQDLRFREGSTDEVSSKGPDDDEDMYTTFNVLIRRKTQENNFKAVLETMRGLMQNDLVVPAWLQSVLLGYGDPGSAHYSCLIQYPQQVDFRDTFLDEQHVIDSFPQRVVRFKADQSVGTKSMEPPFMLCFEQVEADPTGDNSKAVAHPEESITVSTYHLPNMGPYLQDIPKRNTIRFTARQVEAIRAGCSPGLTLVVGPPGTGKTDVAVQTIANLYHTFPTQRILLVTHSNQALNQLFAKIAALDIAPRHLLRLGHGEEELEMEESFGKFGRVESFLQRRLELLRQVDQLAASLHVPGDHGATCETASYFYVSHVLSRWEPYQRRLRELAQELHSPVSPNTDDEVQLARVRDIIVKGFPFTCFFEDAPLPLFPADQGFLQWIDNAQGCFRHLHRLFTELEGIRAFELLRTNADRSNYLLTKEARIVAMTCTHAALRRQQLATLGFQYDTVVMEEAAQILEVETFIPLLLQTPAFGRNRLKRVMLIGDHHQLPPVVKNVRFQKYGNMEQSLFARLIRLGVPHIQLDRQGRARPCLAKLYSWRYHQLGNLPNVLQEPQYLRANPGFAYPFQMVDVDDYQGQGESQPVPYFYQNLGEAEYVVAVYQYMRLRGYPADKIAILTTYNGQRSLIRDVLNKRCGWSPYFGVPAKVTTVDKYQGQQNDYILLSLVRTRGVGHIRDIRRLVVALSRSRLGLYVFGRRSLFTSCLELESTFRLLGQYPNKLTLVPEETYDSGRVVDLVPENSTAVTDVKAMGKLVYDMIQKQLPVHQPAPSGVLSSGDSSDSDHPMKSDDDNVEEVQAKSSSESSASLTGEESAANE
ncbi:hypothetical protein IWQ61_001861 [Dispira simplex]|nr:hypothetical protein IWQ61_001861 [Dispira simplex]